MTDAQWAILLDVIAGKTVDPLPLGFIIDCPWLPGWAGISTLDYFTSDEAWFDANRRAAQTFPEAIFLPGFWSEYGQCTEPSAFGAKCVWHTHDTPFAETVFKDLTDIDRLKIPNPRTDGLCPFVLNRYARLRSRIEAAGHHLRFATARGPINIASFLLGATDLMLGLVDDPKRIHALLEKITDFTVQWLDLQLACADTMDAILIFDDLVGFLGPKDFETFALPYLKRIYDSVNVSVKMFHNDASGKICSSYLPDIGVNIFNFSYMHSLADMREWTRNKVTLFGNIPPRDVLEMGSEEQVREAVYATLASLDQRERLVLSLGGGMSNRVPEANVHAFIAAARGSFSPRGRSRSGPTPHPL